MLFTCQKNPEHKEELDVVSRFKKYCTNCAAEVKAARKEARAKLRKSFRIRTKDIEEVKE